jgi:hypothetical protein
VHAICERIRSGFATDLQRILHATPAVVFIARSLEIARHKAWSEGAELSGQGAGDHEDAPERLRATCTF